jgi:hypothetical protein
MSSPPTRSRVRASRLRAEAGAAKERLDAFELHDGIDAGPDLSPADAARWAQAVRLVAQTERAATRAEAREAALPTERRREAQGRARAATREANAGTRVVKVARVVAGETADAADLCRVAGCNACGATAELRGDPWRLWALGWGSVRDVAAQCGTWPRRWFCPECWVPPVMTEDSPAARLAVRVARPEDVDDGRAVLAIVGDSLLPVLGTGSRKPGDVAADHYRHPHRLLTRGALLAGRQRAGSRVRRHLERDLRQLAAVDPTRAEEAVQQLVATAPSVYLENCWKAFAKEVVGGERDVGGSIPEGVQGATSKPSHPPRRPLRRPP